VERIYEQIDDLLDSEDAINILADGHRAIHYARGFRLSPCHHELLAVQIEQTLGVSRPEPVGRASSVEAPADDGATSEQREPGRIDVLDVSLPRDTGRSCLRVLASLAGATGIVLLVPFVMLLIGLPVALVVRGIAEAIGWLLARTVG
jgi:hypothetical protein